MLRTVSTNEDRNYETRVQHGTRQEVYEALPSTVRSARCALFSHSPKSAPADIEEGNGSVATRERTVKGQDINLAFHFIWPRCLARHGDMNFNKFNSDRK